MSDFPTIVCLCKAESFLEWKKVFDQHGDNKKITMGNKEVELPFSRGEFCDEDVTELFLNADTSKPNEWAIFIEKVDLVKMGAAMGSDAFKEITESLKFEMLYGPATLTRHPEGPPPPDTTSANIVGIVECKDFDAWYTGFIEHATSKSVGGFKLPFSRSEFCDDSKTVVYRSLKNPNKILLGMFAVKGERITMQDPSFLKLIETLGEIPESKQLLIMTPLPPPPVDSLADNATPNAPPVKVKTTKAYGGGVTIMKSFM